MLENYHHNYQNQLNLSTSCWSPLSPKMTEHSSSMSSGNREKSSSAPPTSRPFYELPAHIKPCSKIIQETRMQLKYSSKLGSNTEVPSSYTGFGGGDSGGLAGNGFSDFYGGKSAGNVVELPNIHSDSGGGRFGGGGGATGIKPVDTKRPFTPRDNVSLWGVSARKRPPSAITLSRLAIDESMEEPGNILVENGGHHEIPNGQLSAGKKQYRVPKVSPPQPLMSLGKVPKLLHDHHHRNHQSNRTSYSFDSATDILGGLVNNPARNGDGGSGATSPSMEKADRFAAQPVEKARLQLKSLSLQNDRTSSFDNEFSIRNNSAGRTSTIIPENAISPFDNFDIQNPTKQHSQEFPEPPENPRISLRSQSSFHHHQKTLASSASIKSTNGGTTGAPQNDHNSSQQHSYEDIDCLEMAITCLQNIVSQISTSAVSVKSVRNDVILVLKKVRTFVPEVHTSSPQLKTKLLRLIFKLVERNQTDEDILFWASFVLLHCNIVGNNLTTIFKMVFKASRSREYWGIIKETEYLDVLMSSFAEICPKSQTESMIYGYGTLKFICMDTSVLHRCIELNLVPIMALHLKVLNNEVYTMKDVPETIFNGTFQLTSILRSVVGEDSSILDLVVRSGLLEELCNSLQWTIADIDVVSNIVRILSVISMDDMCCQVISQNDRFEEAIVKVLKLWMNKDDVMVRVTYCLGNLFAKSDEMRVKLYERPDTIQLILNLISFHVKKPTPISMDILVKTVRIIANWILNPNIGWEICDDQFLSELLYSILLMNNVTEELVLCVISTMNNTSFYKDYNAVDDYTLRTAEYLFCNLITKDADVKAEAMKVLGNLTRNPDVRCAAVEYVDNVLHCLDEETDEELLCATCGVLINIIVDEKVKSEFIRLDGIESLVNLLRTRDDLAVIMMATQIMWNLTISNMENDHLGQFGISPEKKVEIRRLLLSKLEMLHPDNQLNNNNNISNKEEGYLPQQENGQMTNSYHAEFYNDFVTVARSLLEKM